MHFFGARFVIHLAYLKHLLMLIKLNPILPAFARQERVRRERVLTKKHWINIDRIVMAALFVSVIAGALIFS
jgi:hypothetical protein